jgi:hypothetical protein
LGFEGFEVFAVEEKLFVFGFGFLYGLEEVYDFLKLWREFFDGLKGSGRGR